jgi:hypothetical protein
MLVDKNAHAHFTLDSFNVAKETPATAFTTATNTRGDFDGTAMPYTLFNVTGDVIVRVYGVCTTTIVSAGGGTLSVGVTNNTAKLIASTTAASITTTVNFWPDATIYDSTDLLSKVTGPFIIVNSANIIETIGTADISAGQLYYICLWRPISHDGLVTPAG